jgi:hypothetical protein
MLFSQEPIPRSLIKYTKADFSESADGIKKWKEIREEGKRLFKSKKFRLGEIIVTSFLRSRST